MRLKYHNSNKWFYNEANFLLNISFLGIRELPSIWSIIRPIHYDLATSLKWDLKQIILFLMFPSLQRRTMLNLNTASPYWKLVSNLVFDFWMGIEVAVKTRQKKIPGVKLGVFSSWFFIRGRLKQRTTLRGKSPYS